MTFAVGFDGIFLIFFHYHSKGSKLLTRNKLEGLPNEGDARATSRFASIIAREYPQFSSAAY